MVTVELAHADEHAQVRAFYATVGYGGGVAEADRVLVAKADGRLVGAVRLCSEAGVVVLRGMQVAPGYQGQGHGRALLAHCLPYFGERAYCLPYDHLLRFYRQAGFDLVQPGELPAFLAQRLASYVASGQPVLAMRRLA